MDEAITQYEQTAKYYEDNGLTVQAIAVRKKADKVREFAGSKKPQGSAASEPAQPVFKQSVPKSPLFEVLSAEERTALVKEMELEQHEEGSHGIGRYMEVFATHPWLPKRVLAMRVFAESQLYRQAMGQPASGLTMSEVDSRVAALLKGDGG